MFPPSLHAPISPSRLQRIIDCPGSYKLARDIEEGQSSTYAQEGTHLHAAVETHLRKYELQAWNTEVSHKIVDPPLNDEQRNAVQDCVDYLGQTIRPLEGPSLQIKIEDRVFLKEFHSVLYDCYGTCDVVLTTDTELHVVDWKFGKGIPVYARDNDQLMAYLCGAIRNFESLFLDAPRTMTFHIHVVQPRLDIYDHIELTAEEIDQWLSSRLIPGITRAYEKHAPYQPGVKQCRWCPAKNTCRARFNLVNKTAADIFQAHAQLPDEISLDELSDVLQHARQYEAYIKDLRLFIQRKLEIGTVIPGWKMVHGRSLRRWAVEEDEIVRMLTDQGADFDELYKSKLVSPAQAEKLRRGWKKEGWLADMIEKPEGKPTLVHEKDPRKPIDYQTAEEKFKEATEC